MLKIETEFTREKTLFGKDMYLLTTTVKKVNMPEAIVIQRQLSFEELVLYDMPGYILDDLFSQIKEEILSMIKTQLEKEKGTTQ